MALRLPESAGGRPDPGQILLVIHDFQARSSDELSLLKGDRVELVERDDDFGDGWYLGKHLMNGQTGLFPEVYTKPAPRGPPIYAASATLPRPAPAPAPTISLPTPPIQPSNPTSNTTSNPTSNQFSVPDADVSAQDNRKSVPVPEADKTTQAIRHVSASQVLDSNVTSPLITLAPAKEDRNLEPGTLSAVPRSLSMSSATTNIPNQNQDSPVMSETLGVIQEHIADMGTPRHAGLGERKLTNDSGSDYSSHLDRRTSYINGEETDEEEDSMHSEAEVSGWNARQVSNYLASVGVEQKHCEIFVEQEITGDVLLGMEQTSVFMKEFELGSVGRRLKTWHKIKSLQDEVKGIGGQRRATQTYGSDAGSETSKRRSHSNPTVAVLPRIPSMNEKSGDQTASQRQNRFPQSQHQPSRSQTMTNAVSSSSPLGHENHQRRPSAASIRDLHHSRRNSANDFGASLRGSRNSLATDTTTVASPDIGHRKQPSFDRNWTMGSHSPSLSRPLSSSGDGELLQGVIQTTPYEFDRGYFSSNEADGRQKNVLRKKTSTSHSRNSSYADEQRIRTATTNAARHSRFGSVDSIQQSQISPASQKYYGLSIRGSNRRTPSMEGVPRPMLASKDMSSAEPSPTVTKLDGFTKTGTESPKSLAGSWLKPGARDSGHSSLRVNSDSVKTPARPQIGSPMDEVSSPVEKDSLKSPSRTGSSTTSGGPSFELDSNSAKSPNTLFSPSNRKSSKSKTKKETSAYTRGLEKKTPQEQMIDCDYSGWMKKKNTNLMTTWKQRLFILKGRRLSYYYSEDDTEEKGLIDISFHRVLPADTDRITGLHATLTGATSGPTSPLNSHTPTLAATQAANEPQSTLSEGKDQVFIFKLVPPRPGYSRVNFTKPTVHYFAVPNIAQGRLWMAALMKATIERDETTKMTTTYQQKTISLAKARAMRHRPPALMNLDEKVEDDSSQKTPGVDITGLNIRGIIFDQASGDKTGNGAASATAHANDANTSNGQYSEKQPLTA